MKVALASSVDWKIIDFESIKVKNMVRFQNTLYSWKLVNWANELMLLTLVGLPA